jgi:hypothetical protein
MRKADKLRQMLHSLRTNLQQEVCFNTLWSLRYLRHVWPYGIDILQIVSILPHEQFDKLHEVCIEKLLQMSKVIQCHEKCPMSKVGKKICLWPKYHSDLQSIIATGKYRGIPILDNDPEQNRTWIFYNCAK